MLLFVTEIAFFVGGVTMLGALAGFVIKKDSKEFNAAVLSFAGGIMGAAASMELIAPVLIAEDGVPFLAAVLSIAAGAVFIRFLEKSMLLLRRFLPRRLTQGIPSGQAGALRRVLLFVAAIAIHNFPEGLAAGVSCAMDNRARAFAVALGIAVQNFPEGMVLIRPMLSAGLSKRKTLLLALSTGWVEIAGAFLGWALVSAPFPVLSYMLPFAGGTMLYIIHVEVIPESLSASGSRVFSLWFFTGYCITLLLNHFIGA